MKSPSDTSVWKHLQWVQTHWKGTLLKRKLSGSRERDKYGLNYEIRRTNTFKQWLQLEKAKTPFERLKMTSELV